MDNSQQEIRKQQNISDASPGESDATHYLGNDDYAKKKEVKKPNPKLDGKVAEGNEDDKVTH